MAKLRHTDPRQAYLEPTAPKGLLKRTEISERSIAYATGILDLFRELLLDVIRRRRPHIKNLFTEKRTPADDDADLLHTLQARGIWFQLLNILEQNATMRRRRDIETSLGAECNDGTFMHLFANARRLGISADMVQALLDRALVQPVITAHPTEAKRITVLQIHRRIYLLLKDLEGVRWTPRERNNLKMRLRDEIDLLWMTGEIRLEKPSVEDEIAWGYHFFQDALFEATHAVHEALAEALAEYYPEVTLATAPLLRFGSWIGGDRDGNPFVTAETMRRALLTSRRNGITNLRAEINELLRQLSIAAHTIEVPGYFRKRLDELLDASGERDAIEKRNPGELFRQYARCMAIKLKKTAAVTAAIEWRSPTALAQVAGGATSYGDAGELIGDLDVMHRCLGDVAADGLARRHTLRLMRMAGAFGFRTASLDLRENSTRINRATAEILEKTGLQPPAASSEYLEWVQRQLDIPSPEPPADNDLSEHTAETFRLFRLIAEAVRRLDTHALGNFILSMTQNGTDVLNVYLLAKFAGLFEDGACRIAVVPLLETIEDLRKGPEILGEVLRTPAVRRTIDALGGAQEIMVGYSDSNKDGGFVCSNWEVSKAQKRLRAVGEEHDVAVSFFHGRGGSSSRGGAPIDDAIAAQPPFTVDGRIRVTEQGEVVSAKFANRGTAEHQLETLCAAAFGHSLLSGVDPQLKPNGEFDAAMEVLSEASYAAYRGLIEQDGLVLFYEAASPVSELALLKMGSRPAQRFGAGTLDDLRAIPWVFAWSQNRMMVPGWFGFGTAIQKLASEGKPGLKLLKTMLNEHPLFRLIANEVEKNLPQVNLDIAAAYAELVPDAAVRERIFGIIRDEHRLSERMLLEITGKKHLCERFPRFSRRLERRLPMVNQAGFEQVRLITELRGMDAKDDPRYREKLVALLLSINCVAAGLGWTG